MRENEETYSKQVIVKHVTEKALLVEDEDDEDGEEVWIPHSQIHDDSELWDESKKGDRGKLVISEWMAKKIGWL